MELLLLGNENKPQSDKSNYVYNKDFYRSMYNKTKHKEKNMLKWILYILAETKALINHQEVCLKINCKQGVSRD